MAALLRAAFVSLVDAGGVRAAARALRGFHTGAAWTNSSTSSRHVAGASSALALARAPGAAEAAPAAAPRLGIAATIPRLTMTGVRAALACQPVRFQHCPAPPAPLAASASTLAAHAQRHPPLLGATAPSQSLSSRSPAGRHSARTALEAAQTNVGGGGGGAVRSLSTSTASTDKTSEAGFFRQQSAAKYPKLDVHFVTV